MTVAQYQEQAHSFACYEGLEQKDWTYPVMGLAEEAGEVSGKFAKAVRDSGRVVSEERKMEIVKELGDVMWMVAEIATLIDTPLEDIMIGNIEKLKSRKNRGVIHGSGDNR